MAERQGLVLHKSRRRDPLAIDHGGFMLADARTNAAVMGAEPFAFSADLDEIEAYLTTPR